MKRASAKSAKKKSTKKAARKQRSGPSVTLSSVLKTLPKKEPRLTTEDKHLVGYFASATK